MKLYLIAGEASGDLHGAALMSSLLEARSGLQLRFWGGDEMASVGGTPVKHIKELAFMGFYEVVRHLPTIFRNIRMCKRDILKYKPDALVLIDYPGFNLRIAKWAHRQGIRVIYYISPQIWAWHQSRVASIKRDVDRMLVILPFEKDFYRSHSIEVDYVGHPLAERLRQINHDPEFRRRYDLDDRPIIALLPGSRKQEVTKMLDIMLKAATNKDYQYLVAQAPNLDESFYQPFLARFRHVRLMKNNTYQLLLHSRAAAVTSGTATLETALLGTPQVVCYKSSPISYSIARRLIKVRFISLVNLIADDDLVPELIQSDLNPDRLTSVLEAISQGGLRTKILEGYDKIQSILSETSASKTAADIILAEIDN